MSRIRTSAPSASTAPSSPSPRRRSRTIAGLVLATSVAGLVAAAAPSAFAQAKQDPGGQKGCSWGGKSYDHGGTRTATYYVKGKKYTDTYRCNNGMWDVVLLTVAPATDPSAVAVAVTSQAVTLG